MPKFKIILINPPVIGVFEPWYDTPDFGRTGLAYLAGYIREYSQLVGVEIIDAKFERLDFGQVLERVKQSNPDMVGLTAYTNEIKPAAYMAGMIKEWNSSVKTVIGGVHVTAVPQETLMEFPSFDIGVVGEGELTLLELCNAMMEKKDLATVPGLALKHDKSIFLTTPRDRILDQESIPFPAWDLLPPAKTYYIQTLRGCPFNCLFCMNPNGRVARKRSVGHVMGEINWLIEAFGPEKISFGDELFSVDMKRTSLLLDEMIKADVGKKVKWDVQTHVKYVDDELFSKFAKASVERVELGIETGDDDALKSMGKGTNISMIMTAVNSARKYNVPVGTFFLFGQPNENPSTLNKTVELAVKINPSLPMFGLMTPYPGTEVARLAAENKAGYKLLSTDWDEYNKQIGGAMSFAGLTRKQIEWFQIKAYLLVYIKNRRFKDLVLFLWEYRVGAFKVLKKILFNKGLSEMMTKPEDYDAFFARGPKHDFEIMVRSRLAWGETQKRELRRAKQLSAE